MSRPWLLTKVRKALRRGRGDNAEGAIDILLINGFWRSGTTWLQESAAAGRGARTVFEPFHPSVSPYLHILGRDERYAGLPISDLQGFMPYHSGAQGAEFGRFLNGVARRPPAQAQSWVGQLDEGRGRLNPREVVLKLVAGHLVLDGACDTDWPVIHLTRDPRAVIASTVRRGWAGAWLGRFSPRRLLLGVEDGRATIFAPWARLIEELDQAPFPIRLSLYWAASEWYARQLAARRPGRLTLANYDELMLDPEKRVAELLTKVGRPVTDATAFRRKLGVASAMAAEPGKAFKPPPPWDTQLDGPTLQKLDQLVREFDLADLLHSRSSA